MKKRYYLIFCFFFSVCAIYGQTFDDYFTDKTLRADYYFCGDYNNQHIYLDELSQFPLWAGRKQHLAQIPLEGNGQLTIKDKKTGTVIYKTSFSSLFHEWLATPEARQTSRGFQNTCLLPFPKDSIEIQIRLQDEKKQEIASFIHNVYPDDILIRKTGDATVTPYQYLLQNGTIEECINIAILAEGYTINEKELFFQDANAACNSLFAHEPFGRFKNKFNVIAVESWSQDSGVSIPKTGEWKNTAFSSHFSTFYSDRYLTTNHTKSIHNILAGIPYEHIIILANTEEYGGGGIYNAFTLTTAHHRLFKQVVVHEFGHSFAGLADEYYNENDTISSVYDLTTEPWEPNITTLIRFEDKWKDMLPPGTPIPTPLPANDSNNIGVFEGGGYTSKGIYRPAVECRMKSNTAIDFCPVCQKAIERLIIFYTQ